MENGKPTFISLFSGCGGSSLGYKWAGFRELLAVDFDKKAVETFRLNFPNVPVWLRDIREVTGREIMKFCGIKKGELDLLDASPPCQGFSTAGKRNVNDSRNDLFMEFVRLVKELKPKVFVMENVSGLIKGKMKGRFIEIMKELKSLPYQVKCKLMNTMYYQVPQSRQRLIWIGIRNNLKVQPVYSKPSNKIIGAEKAVPQLKEKILLTFRYTKGTRDRVRSARFPSPAVTSRLSLANRIEIKDVNIIKKLQSFPEEFELKNGFSIYTNKKILGNAVPPKFMETIARTIKERILCHAPAN